MNELGSSMVKVFSEKGVSRRLLYFGNRHGHTQLDEDAHDFTELVLSSMTYTSLKDLRKESVLTRCIIESRNEALCASGLFLFHFREPID